MDGITYRPAGPDDTYATFHISKEALIDLGERMGVTTITGGDDPEVMTALWTRRRPLFEHLAQTAEHSWIAEKDGEPVGYARSILRGDVRQLTELFLLPGVQQMGIGRELLAQVFPADGAAHRVIIATTTSPATARYLKTGVYARFPIYYASRKAELVTVESDLDFEPVSASPDVFAAMNAIDSEVLGYPREADHRWLMTRQQAYLYARRGDAVGYGYVGASNGPFALLDADDYPAVLAHAENAAAAGDAEFGVELPLINEAAVDYLMARRFRLSTFFTHFMSDAPLGRYANYLFTNPPYFS